MKKITKAIIPAAGLGTRFLPQTKAMPKEMLPIIDKPIIQYVVEDLVSIGVQDIVIVTGAAKRPIEDHFDNPSADLQQLLGGGGTEKKKLLEDLQRIADMANFVYVRQKGPYGNATPLKDAEHLIGDEPFIYTWGDEFIKSKDGQFKPMVDAYNEFDCPIVLTVPATRDEDYDRYGFYAGKQLREGAVSVKQVVEKPGKAAAPTNNYSAGGFLLTPEVLPYVDQLFQEHDGNSEVVIQQAFQRFIDEGNQMVAIEIPNGRYYDTGNKEKYLETIVEIALADPNLGSGFRRYLEKLLSGSDNG